MSETNYKNPQNPPKDGGRAFPSNVQTGMSLRDYFAGIALPACITSLDLDARLKNGLGQETSNNTTNTAAHAAYAFADAMLKARNQN